MTDYGYSSVPGSSDLKTARRGADDEVAALEALDASSTAGRWVHGQWLCRTVVRDGAVAVLEDVFDRLLPALEAEEAAVYLQLYRLSLGRERNWCRTSRKALRARSNLSDRRLGGALAGLVERDHIRLLHRDRRGTLYLVRLPHEILGEPDHDQIYSARPSPSTPAGGPPARTTKAGTTKAGTTKAGTTKAGTTKAGTTKAGTTTASATKASATKTSATKARTVKMAAGEGGAQPSPAKATTAAPAVPLAGDEAPPPARLPQKHTKNVPPYKISDLENETPLTKGPGAELAPPDKVERRPPAADPAQAPAAPAPRRPRTDKDDSQAPSARAGGRLTVGTVASQFLERFPARGATKAEVVEAIFLRMEENVPLAEVAAELERFGKKAPEHTRLADLSRWLTAQT